MPVPMAEIAYINADVNAAFRPVAECFGDVDCSKDWEPRTAGLANCRQSVAEKLRRLLIAGAAPDEFTIWIVRRVGYNDRAAHAVLIHNPTGRVLDNLNPSLPQRWRLTMTYRWVRPCVECAYPAQAAAAVVTYNITRRP